MKITKNAAGGYELEQGGIVTALTDQEYLALYQDCAKLFGGYKGPPSGPPFVVTVQMDYDDVDSDQTTQNYKEPVCYDTLEEAMAGIEEAKAVIQELGEEHDFDAYLEVAPYVEYTHLHSSAPSAKFLVLALYAGWRDGVNMAWQDYAEDEDDPYEGEDDGDMMQHRVFKSMTPEERKEIFDYVQEECWC